MGKRIGTFGLVNFRDHPTNKEYRVFNFNTKEQAELFEQFLNEKKVWFERDEEEHEEDIIYLFGVHQKDYDRAMEANYMAYAKTRKPMIPIAFFRYALVFFFFALIVLAIIGYINR